jgi:hypothetical protein
MRGGVLRIWLVEERMLCSGCRWRGERRLESLGGLNETTLPEPTSVGLGREEEVRITAAGSVMAPIYGTYTERGKVVAVEVD